MKLTGKAKDKFEKWYQNNSVHYYDGTPIQLGFDKLDVRCQWGVIQDFADSVGVDIYINPYHDWVTDSMEGYNWYAELRNESYISGTGNVPTIQEARNAAIEKLNEILNG
jgi:hypothetical protein